MTPAYSYTPRGAALELLRCRAPEVMIVGAAGTGKTRAVLQKLHAVCEKYERARLLILREYRIALNETVLVTWETKVVPPNHPALAGPDRSHRTRYSYPNGSEIVLGGLDQPERFMSGEYDIVYLAEGTDVRDEGKYEMLLSRLRNGRVPYQQALIDANPTVPSHWLNQRPERKRIDGAPVMVRLISLHADNPSITPEYLETLRNLTGARRARLYEGKWAGSEGLIYDFERSRHVKPCPFNPKSAKRIVVGVDDGFRNPFAALRGLVDGDDHLHIEAERYGPGKGESVKVADIRGIGEGADSVVVDPAAAGLIAALQKADIPAMAADNDVLAGISKLQDRFTHGAITIDPSCTNLIAEIEGYEWQDNAKKDAPVKEKDHGCDAARYLSQAINAVGSSVAIGFGEPGGKPCDECVYDEAQSGIIRCRVCGRVKEATVIDLEREARERWLSEV